MSEDSSPALKFKGLLFLALIAAVLAFVPFPSLRATLSIIPDFFSVIARSPQATWQSRPSGLLRHFVSRNDGKAKDSVNIAKADPGVASIDIDYIVDPVGWLTGWSYRKAITIDNANVDSDLTDFPLLVKITADADIGDGAQVDGDDIRFTDSGGTTLLPYEEESWTGGAGGDATGVFWVKVPTVATAADSTIYVYYGSGSATDGQSATSVWDANYAAVWHLNETGTNPTVYDSTSNNNDSTSQTWTPTTSGEIDGAGSFNGSSNSIGLSDTASLQPALLTISAWTKPSNTTDYQVIFDRETGAPYKGFELSMYNGHWIWEVNGSLINFNATPSTSAFNLLTVSYDGTNANLYYNGALDKSQSQSAIDYSTTIVPVIGSRFPQTSGFFNGSLDEVRISATARSAAWIKFEDANSASATNELTFGTQAGSVPTNAYWIGGTGNWSDTAHWANESGGSGGYSAPASTSNAVFDASSGTGTVTIDTASVSVTNVTQSDRKSG